MKKKARKSHLYYSFRRYPLFFVIVAFSVSCCFLLFLNSLQDVLGVRFTEEQITHAATVTFLNVCLLSLLLTVIDNLFYYFTVYRHVKLILEFTNSLSSGSFGKQISIRHSLFDNEYTTIIDNLNMLSRELANIESMRSEAVNNISHELKTPLSVMHNYARLLCYDDLPNDKKKEYIEAIYSSTERLSQLIKSILDLARLEKSEIFKKDDVLSLSENLTDCIISFDEKLEGKNITLNADIDEDITITSDKELLTLVWNNLISNAIKFSNDGGHIDISLKKNNEDIIVAISDDGVGIKNKDIAHIFDKYYQGKTSREKEGNGLGLAMVKRVLDILDFSITVTSEEGKGSTFKVIIPV